MSSLLIPADWKVKRSTPFFTKENVPAALLSRAVCYQSAAVLAPRRTQ